MGRTDITWEEFDTYEKIDVPENYDFRTKDGKYYTYGEFGIASIRIVFEIDLEDINLYLSGKRTAKEVDFKAINDRWPPTEEEKLKNMKQAIEESLTTLIDFPEYRKLFTQEELERLIPLAEKEWIYDEGKLPEDYVSPLKKK